MVLINVVSDILNIGLGECSSGRLSFGEGVDSIGLGSLHSTGTSFLLLLFVSDPTFFFFGGSFLENAVRLESKDLLEIECLLLERDEAVSLVVVTELLGVKAKEVIGSSCATILEGLAIEAVKLTSSRATTGCAPQLRSCLAKALLLCSNVPGANFPPFLFTGGFGNLYFSKRLVSQLVVNFGEFLGEFLFLDLKDNPLTIGFSVSKCWTDESPDVFL